MIRSSLLEVLNEDYIRTARAKGVFEKLVISRHALRNALLPAITVIGLEFAFLIGGLVVTEQVFNLNGIGKLFVQSVSRNDFTLIQGMVMLIAGVLRVHQPRRSTCSMRCSIRASGTGDGHVACRSHLRSRSAAPRAARSLEFCRQQPLGAVSFVIIFVMMFAGIFCRMGRALRSARHRLRRRSSPPRRGSTGAAPTPTAATSSRASSTARAPRW